VGIVYLLLGFLSGGIEVGLELIEAFIPGDGLSFIPYIHRN